MHAVLTSPPFDPSIKTLGYGVIAWIEATLFRPDGVEEYMRLTA